MPGLRDRHDCRVWTLDGLAAFPVGGVTAYILILFAGFAGSFHCVGMCSGFACAIGADSRGRRATVVRQLVYNIGRVTTYCFLGALAGWSGAALIAHSDSGFQSVVGAQRILAVASGALMLFIGLQFLGYFRRFAHKTSVFGGQLLVPALRDLLKTPGPAAPLAFGVFNGFLPCPLVYAFVAQAAVSGGPLNGLLIMLAFGLGTFPAMLLVGALGTRFGFDWRLRGVRVAGVFIVVFGLVTLLRGTVMNNHSSQPTQSSALVWSSAHTLDSP